MTGHLSQLKFIGTHKRTAIAGCLMALFALTNSASAQAPGSEIVRVEEDWVALVAEPDSATSSPQIMNFISPIQSTSGVFGLVQVNHRGAPDFHSGGLQVQAWVGEWMSGYSEASKTAILSRSSDSLRYTVAMERLSQGIKFQLLNGSSRTWGRFAQTPVSVIVTVEEPSLEEYSAAFSVANTNVNLGAHRVDLLYLTATRIKYTDGTIVTDNTDRVIHRYQINVEDVPVTLYEQYPEDYTTGIAE